MITHGDAVLGAFIVTGAMLLAVLVIQGDRKMETISGTLHIDAEGLVFLGYPFPDMLPNRTTFHLVFRNHPELQCLVQTGRERLATVTGNAMGDGIDFEVETLVIQ